MNIQQLQTIEEFQEAIENNSSLVVLKHSLTCPISTEANKQFEGCRERANIPMYRLYVQEARELSDYLAEKYRVKHESPQALQFINGEVNLHLNHGDIKEEQLKRML
ncbi:bacillithiol system redox-active protein YtxJ [Gracilibacillus alcaliphilus]|uniref:bacillithiol system redox-active protein YtxJ n=1 Tax=Gracilibacillus alcaliphilus TaxID=1401441 RepID=UPI00195856AC|nr:bacillithiol system protein YtxJ [Gracilibacillus alcaliphilus]